MHPVHYRRRRHAPDVGRFTESDGRVLDPPRALEEGLARLRKEQRALSRKFEALKAAQTAENRAAKAEGREARRLPRSNRLKRQIAEVGRALIARRHVRCHLSRKSSISR